MHQSPVLWSFSYYSWNDSEISPYEYGPQKFCPRFLSHINYLFLNSRSPVLMKDLDEVFSVLSSWVHMSHLQDIFWRALAPFFLSHTLSPHLFCCCNHITYTCCARACNVFCIVSEVLDVQDPKKYPVEVWDKARNLVWGQCDAGMYYNLKPNIII